MDVLQALMPMPQIVVHVTQIFQVAICVKMPHGVLLVRMGTTWIKQLQQQDFVNLVFQKSQVVINVAATRPA